MVTHDDIRRIASELPGAKEGSGDRFGFHVVDKGKEKGFLWTWLERVHPKKARVNNNEVLAIVTPNLMAKDLLIESEPEKYFTEPHYNGFPAVLVRLAAVDENDLRDLIIEAWRTKAPKELVREFEAQTGEL